MTDKELIERVARAVWAERVRYAKDVSGMDLESYDVMIGDRKVAELNNILGEARIAIEAVRSAAQ